MTSPTFRGWPYVVHVPEDYRGDEPFPLLIYLSGGPGRAMLGALGARETVERLGYLVVFPQANEWWWHERPTALVAALLEVVLRTFNVDTNRVYLAGFSNGGTGAFSYATVWPHRLAAVVPMMSAGIYPSDGEPPLPANAAQLPQLFLHGDKDERILVQATHDTVKELRRAASSVQVEVHIFKGRGHDVWLGSDDGLTIKFLQQHVRDPFPRRVKLQIRSLQFPRRYWIEILSKDDGIAEVEGQIDDDNAIRLKSRKVGRLRLLLRRELLPRSGPVRVVFNGKEVFAGTLSEDCGLLQRSWQATADPFLAHSAELAFDVPR